MTDLPVKLQKFVQLDLKGAAPKIDYLRKIFPLFYSWGATGVLIEYEDMFPYRNMLSPLRSPYAYSERGIEEIISLASQNHLDVIPLIQTFGHFENVLKHDCYRHIREVDLYPNALCPNHKESFDIVTGMLEQVLNLHLDVKFIHIGADEVWHLGKCTKCCFKMEENNWNSIDLFLDWVSKIAKWVKEKRPSIDVLMWDDMLRTFPVNKLKEFSMGELTQPMIWRYEAKDITFPPGMFDRFSEVFSSIWVASAFKGATGSTQFLTPAQHHINNHLSWISIIAEITPKFKSIQGIVITGWQRYDHYAVLCELLPTALPCLALCLRALKNDSFTAKDHDDVSKELGFIQRINVLPFPRPQILEQGMNFPGHELYVAVQMWSNFVSKYQAICSSEGMVGWFSDYFKSKNFTNPAQVENIMHPLIELQKNMFDLRQHIQLCLTEIFFDDTVEEWIGCYFTPLLEKIKCIIKDCKEQMLIGGRVRNYGANRNQM